MKCPECDGYKNFVSLAGTPFEVVRPCKRCGGAGKIQQTNEEWFCGLSTEEKADFLANIYPKSVGEALIMISNGDKDRWEKWLKEKHE